MSSATADSVLAVLCGGLLACAGTDATIDVCARGDREELASAIAGGSFRLEILDAEGAVVAGLTSPADRSTWLDARLPPSGVRVELAALDAHGTPRGRGSGRLDGRGACVCLALAEQFRAACEGIACSVEDDRCRFRDEETGVADPTRTLSFGDNPDDDLAGRTADTHLVEGYYAADNFGGAATIEIDSDPLAVGLLRFDLADLPRAASVEEALLTLTTADPGSADPVELYRVLEAWDEGAAIGAPGCASWSCRAPGAPWAVPGCGHVDATTRSREGDPFASFVAMGQGGSFSVNVSAVVSEWVRAPGTNLGVALTTSAQGVDFVAREAEPQAGSRPRLRVSYRLP